MSRARGLTTTTKRPAPAFECDNVAAVHEFKMSISLSTCSGCIKLKQKSFSEHKLFLNCLLIFANLLPFLHL